MRPTRPAEAQSNPVTLPRRGRRADARGLIAVGVAVALMAACAPTTTSPGTIGTNPASSTGTVPASASGTESAGTAHQPTAPATEPAAATVTDYRVTYGFDQPTSMVTVNHAVHPPIAGPNDPPLPYLAGIYVGNHPQDSPAYQRISFYFRGAFPGYRFGYVPQVLSDGKGTPVSLTGNAFLQISFLSAQAHDNAGSTVTASPHNPIGFHNLVSYAAAGDFEGQVTYGLGLQAAPNSDQVLNIRAGELKKSDGSGGFYYVIFFDVQTA